jgi:hypothetical protein
MGEREDLTATQETPLFYGIETMNLLGEETCGSASESELRV